MMEKKYTSQLKLTIQIHAILMAGFAAIYIFLPVQWGDLTGCLFKYGTSSLPHVWYNHPWISGHVCPGLP